MKAKVNLDKRDELEKKYDLMFNTMVRKANLNPKQRIIVFGYLRNIIGERIREVENAMNMGFWLGLIELEHFGCNKRAIKLPRLQNYVRDVVNDAYGKECIDANGCIAYDGCGIERLKYKLHALGVEFVDV